MSSPMPAVANSDAAGPLPAAAAVSRLDEVPDLVEGRRRRVFLFTNQAVEAHADNLRCAFGLDVEDLGIDPDDVGGLAAAGPVLQVDAQRRFEQSWAEIQRYLLAVLDVAGVDPVASALVPP